jgi:VWFA-related protein
VNRIRPMALLTVAALLSLPGSAQQNAVSPAGTQTPTLKSSVDEVVLDIVVRDKKGKPVIDLKPEDVIVFDNAVRQRVNGFRLVRGAEAITQGDTVTRLDPLRQVRLVTLAFEALAGGDQRKMARAAAMDLIKGDQGTNVFYAVVVVNTRLLLLQQFTNDKAALANAIDRATTGLAVGKLASESDAIKDQLKRNLNGQNGADQDHNLLAAATQTSTQTVSSGSEAMDAKLASIMLDMLRMDAAISSRNARMSIEALKSLVQGQQSMPGRKSILYFTSGMYVTSELDVMFSNLVGMANRANVTFYAVDPRGVMTVSQTSDATSELNAAAAASAVTVNRRGGATSKAEIMSSDDAEGSARSNVQLRLRELAESTGGFLIADSNDLRGPLRHVNEEISSYYELTFNPDIQNYDGSFRKLSVSAERKGLVIHARSGYFALPPEARALGLQAFELPLLKALSDGKLSGDVEFRAGAVLLQPRAEGADVSVLVEVPLRGLQPKTDPAKNTLGVHCSLAALIKNAKGEVVQKLTRDRSFQVTADQLKMGNFVDKMTITVPAGPYTLESAVMDRESGKIGTGRSAFTIESKAKGVGISSLTTVRSYVAGAKGLDPADPFQFQGGSITPTLNNSVQRSQDAALRLFFIVYPDSSIAATPTVDIEFIQNGRALTKVPMPLPAVDAQGKIPYVMTIPAAAIPPGSYEVRATAKQGDTVSESRIAVRIDKI